MKTKKASPLRKKLCADIKIARTRRGFSLREIAARLGISPTTYTNFENHGTGSFALFCDVTDLLSLSPLLTDALDPYKDREATRRELLALAKKRGRHPSPTSPKKNVDGDINPKKDDLDF